MFSTKPADKIEAKHDDVELYKCICCNGYLSSAPLKIAEDGINILCSKCPAEKFGRNEIVESLLATVHFPCMFKNYGCKERPVFGRVDEHQAVCQFKHMSCFVLPVKSCEWKGQTLELMKHLHENHAQNVISNGEFVFGRSASEENVYVFEHKNVVTIVYYTYDRQKKEFKYCIRYISHYNNKIEYDIKIAISNNERCSLSFNYNKHKLYRGYSFSHESLLNLHHILPFVEENAETFLFSVKLKVHFDELEKLKCVFCSVYVTLPIFKTEDGNVACSLCAEKHLLEPVEDEELKQLMTTVYYPCRWKHCIFMEAYNKIRQHEETCQYREVDCPVKDCYETFKFENADNHFETEHKKISKIESGFLANYDFYYSYTSNTIKCSYGVAEGNVFLITITFKNNTIRYDVIPKSASRLVPWHLII